MAIKVGVGVLTFNHITTGRQQDFWRTWHSIQEGGHPAEYLVLTNGSTDGTENVVAELGGVVDDADNRVWYGNTRLIEELAKRDCELIVLSADDLLYEEGWLLRLLSFLQEAPDDIALTSCYVEPLWDWNRPVEIVEAGGQKALIRESICGSSWVFRTEDWQDWMGPFEPVMPGEDLLVCEKIRGRGARMAALNLTKHIGQERSAWGNQSHLTAQPLPKEWQI